MAKKSREQRMILSGLRGRSDGGIVFGYAARFNSPSDDLGGYVEVIQPGAFKKTLSEKADVRLLINHEGVPLGRTKSGTLNLSEDEHGLYFECQLDPSNPKVQELNSALTRKDIDQCSFGFYVHKDAWGRNERGYPMRTIVEAELFDVSIVTIPAYSATSAALRSLFNDESKMKELFSNCDDQELDKISKLINELKTTAISINIDSKCVDTIKDETCAEEPVKVDHSTDDIELNPTPVVGSSAQEREREILMLEI